MDGGTLEGRELSPVRLAACLGDKHLGRGADVFPMHVHTEARIAAGWTDQEDDNGLTILLLQRSYC